MNEIYGFVGQMGSGKTYHALKKAQEMKSIGRSVLLISWADPIKQMIYDKFYMTKSGFQDGGQMKLLEKLDNECIDEILQSYFVELLSENHLPKCRSQLFKACIHPYIDEIENTLRGAALNHKDYNTCFRKLIQFIGTEIGRSINETLWIDVVLNRIKIAFTNNVAQVAIIDDIRFMNEFDGLKDFSFVNQINCIIKAVTASMEVRASRINATVQDLEMMSKHESEIEVLDICRKLNKNDIIFN